MLDVEYLKRLNTKQIFSAIITTLLSVTYIVLIQYTNYPHASFFGVTAFSTMLYKFLHTFIIGKSEFDSIDSPSPVMYKGANARFISFCLLISFAFITLVFATDNKLILNSLLYSNIAAFSIGAILYSPYLSKNIKANSLRVQPTNPKDLPIYRSIFTLVVSILGLFVFLSYLSWEIPSIILLFIAWTMCSYGISYALFKTK